MVCDPEGYAVSPVVSAKVVSLAAISLIRSACGPLFPPPSTWPQSPNTAKENGVVERLAIWARNDGVASVPRRSVEPSKIR